MIVKTSELTDMALDYAVALADRNNDAECAYSWVHSGAFAPSEVWDDGGVYIEQEKISLDHNEHFWWAFIRPCEVAERMTGPTPLIAAMRCFVASKLGDEIEIPEEFL